MSQTDNKINDNKTTINEENNESVINPTNTTSTQINPNTTIVTSELGKEFLQNAMYNYQSYNNNLERSTYNYNSKGQMYSSYFNSQPSLPKIDLKMIDTLAFNAQSNLENIKQINTIVRYYINKNDLIGKVYEVLESNVNTEIQLSFKPYEGRNKIKIKEKVRSIIEDFNEKIDLDSLLSEAVAITYTEGNYPMDLRKTIVKNDYKQSNYIVDSFPLGVVIVSDVFNSSNDPVLLMDMNELKSRLQKTTLKDKKGKPLFFKNIEDEIKNNYSDEIYKAYKNKETYAKLNIQNTGMLRVNNLRRKYGLTPVFRAIKPALMLDTFENTDKQNAEAKGKRIIFQKLRPQLLGKDGDKIDFEPMAYSHMELVKAYKTDPCLYTGTAWVESVQYVEPKSEPTNINTINSYRNKMMTALGIAFLNAEKNSISSAQISIKELMKNINKITTQLEKILTKWYKGLLIDYGIDIEYCPKIKVIDSELLETELRIQLVDLLYSKLNCSFRTAYETLGYDYSTEKQRRTDENKEKMDDVFVPHLTAFVNSGKEKDDKGGRPTKEDNLDKKQYDKQRVEGNDV